MYFKVLLWSLALISPSFCHLRGKHGHRNVHQVQLEIDEGISKFGINLHKLLLKLNLDQGKNVLVSPISLYFSLALTHLAAAGVTRDEIRNVMGLPAAEEWILKSHQNLGELYKRLQHSEHSNVTVVNGLFLQNGIKTKDLFLTQIKQFYDSNLINVDFSKKEVIDEINKWFESQTNGVIKQFFDQALSLDTKLLLANALTFNGKWDRNFPQDLTKTEVFVGVDGIEQKVNMIRKTDHIPYYLDLENKFEVVGIPYQNFEYCMYIILPNESENLKDFIEIFSHEILLKIVKGAVKQTVDLKIPQIKTKSINKVKDLLQQLGIRKLFESPDLSNMLTQLQLKVTEVLQLVELEVTELGTGISAGTAQEYVPFEEYIPNDEVKQFFVQKPFLFFIYHPYTKSVLYFGSILKVNDITDF